MLPANRDSLQLLPNLYFVFISPWFSPTCLARMGFERSTCACGGAVPQIREVGLSLGVAFVYRCSCRVSCWFLPAAVQSSVHAGVNSARDAPTCYPGLGTPADMHFCVILGTWHTLCALLAILTALGALVGLFVFFS